MSIQICKGNVLEPCWSETNRIIIHNCNDEGKFGAGVAYSILKKWPHVAECYKEWYRRNLPQGSASLSHEVWKHAVYTPDSFRLGDIQIVQAEPSIFVTNILGQKGMGTMKIGRFELPPVRYEALYEGFLRVREWVKEQYESARGNKEYTFHLPMLSHGLGEGDFNITYKMYLKAFNKTNSRTMFYAFSNKDFTILEKIYKDNV